MEKGEIWFKVLGPLEVYVNERPVDFGAGMHRRLLAALLTRPGRVLTSDELVDALWPEQPPTRAVKTVQLYAHRLRRDLGDSDLVVHRPGGYLLAAEPAEVDAYAFVDLVRAALDAHAAGDPAEAYHLLDQALGLWGGTPYVELADRTSVRPEIDRLTEWRIRALEERASIGLDRGEHTDLLPELSGLVTAHPYRERLCGLLMLALYRSSRQADALEQYRGTRDRLVDELGVEPGEDLRQLHERILRCDPALDRPESSADQGESTGRPVRPAQLPPQLASFTGRDVELRELSTIADTVPHAVVVLAIDGMPGVGKTVLAVRLAHQLVQHFPDGQLFVDLHGFTPGVEPTAPTSMLERLLRALGVPGDKIPHDIDDRAALWRSQLNGLRMLIVLDNASSEAQVRPLLPGVPGCLVLVTSRRRLADLDDAHPLSLQTLPVSDAVRLFARVADLRESGDQSGQLVERVVELCGQLPLAIRLAAARFRHRSTWRLPDLITRLQDESGRLGHLATGERSVSDAFELSYTHLPDEHQRAFRLLGLHPGMDFDAYSLAALADVGVDKATRTLEDLVDLHLLEAEAYGRYTFHDLLRIHAANKLESETSPDERQDAVARLFDYYLYATEQAHRAYVPGDLQRWQAFVDDVRTPVPTFPTMEQAASWLDTERRTLIAVADQSANHAGMHAIGLSTHLFRYLSNNAYRTDARVLHEHALRSARARGDRENEGRTLNVLGNTFVDVGDNTEAINCFRHALVCATETDNPVGQLTIGNNLGRVLRYVGDYPDSLAHARESLRLAQAVDDRLGIVRSLEDLAHTYLVLGDLDSAQQAADEAELSAREFANPRVSGGLRTLIGEICKARGNHADALEHQRRAAELFHDEGIPWMASLAEVRMANALRELGRHVEALHHHTNALALAERLADSDITCVARLGLGETLRAAGRADEAIGHLETALQLADELGQPADQARAHEALGRAFGALGQDESATRHLERALQIYRRLGTPDAERVTALLS